MQVPEGQIAQGQPGGASGEFLIPNLCSSRAVFVMVLLVELLVLVFTLASSSLPRFDWSLLAACSLFVQWVVLVSAALLCPLRKLFAQISLWATSVIALLLVMAVAGVTSLLAISLYPQLSFGAETSWWMTRNILIALVLAGIALRYFYLQQQLQQREKSELQARLDSLHARIRPHFLFNTMNSIASLIATNPEAAEEAVEDLSELFRASLRDDSQAFTVADELRLCDLYLRIEQLRLGSRLRVSWQIEDGVRQLAMPGLIMQPLVENAVYHGIAQIPEGGEIQVTLQRESRHLRVIVVNPIPGESAHTAGHKMALFNIEQRLQGLYGPEAGLLVEKVAQSYRTELYYPVENRP